MLYRRQKKYCVYNRPNTENTVGRRNTYGYLLVQLIAYRPLYSLVMPDLPVCYCRKIKNVVKWHMIAIQSNSIIASDLEWRSVISPAILLVNVVCTADARSPCHFLFTISNLVDLLASSNSRKKDNLITNRSNKILMWLLTLPVASAGIIVSQWSRAVVTIHAAPPATNKTSRSLSMVAWFCRLAALWRKPASCDMRLWWTDENRHCW